MAVDKLVDSTQLDTDLTSVANAIRTKGGTQGQLAFPSGFVTAIQNIPSGGITPAGTITISQNGDTDVTNYATAHVAIQYSTIYSGSEAPSSAQGVNGDVYIQTS